MSKKILLLAATQQEILPYLQSNPHHDVLITGVGIPSATFRLTRQLAHHHYDLVVQAGIAGSFAHSFAKSGNVVQVTKDAFGDLGSFENGQFTDLTQLELSLDPIWLNGGTTQTGLPEAKGITVQTITNDASILSALAAKWQADVETMEGAAAAYVCREKQAPFVQIRAISNTVGDRNRQNWNMEEAIHNLNTALNTFIRSQLG
jgi:futalosine hydrolase